MKTLCVIYHSQSGATASLVEAFCAGASLAAQQEGQVQVQCFRASDAGADQLLAADALVFASPENFGYLSGGLKDFFDRTYYPVLERQLNTPYTAIISAGNDGSGAIRQLARIAKGYPFREVLEPTVIRGLPGEGDLEACRELGEAVVAAMEMGMF